MVACKLDYMNERNLSVNLERLHGRLKAFKSACWTAIKIEGVNEGRPAVCQTRFHAWLKSFRKALLQSYMNACENA